MFVFLLTGVGHGGLLSITANGNALTNPETVIASSLNTDFGTVVLYMTSSHTFVLNNAGDQTISFSVSLSGDTAEFSVTSPSSFPASINPSSSTSLTLQYFPFSTGTHAATLTITSNSNIPSFSISIQGSGSGLSACPVAHWLLPCLFAENFNKVTNWFQAPTAGQSCDSTCSGISSPTSPSRYCDQPAISSINSFAAAEVIGPQFGCSTYIGRSNKPWAPDVEFGNCQIDLSGSGTLLLLSCSCSLSHLRVIRHLCCNRRRQQLANVSLLLPDLFLHLLAVLQRHGKELSLGLHHSELHGSTLTLRWFDLHVRLQAYCANFPLSNNIYNYTGDNLECRVNLGLLGASACVDAAWYGGSSCSLSCTTFCTVNLQVQLLVAFC